MKKKASKTSPTGIDAILERKITEGPPILVKGVLPAGGGMILGGESEVGKSLMRVEWSVLLALGLPIYGMATPNAQTVLVFQTENAIRQEQYRTKKIMEGYDISSCHNRIFYARPYRPHSLQNEGFVKHVEHQIEDCGATVLWFDPLVSFHTRNENDNVSMRNVLDVISYLNRKHNCASIIIHHFGQPSTDAQNEIPLRYRLRGASAIRDWADTIITLRHTSRTDNPGPGRVVDFVKIRNGPQRAPYHLKRNRHFVHEVIAEDRKVPLEEVKQVVKAKGRICKHKTHLLQKW